MADWQIWKVNLWELAVLFLAATGAVVWIVLALAVAFAFADEFLWPWIRDGYRKLFWKWCRRCGERRIWEGDDGWPEGGGGKLCYFCWDDDTRWPPRGYAVMTDAEKAEAKRRHDEQAERSAEHWRAARERAQ